MIDDRPTKIIRARRLFLCQYSDIKKKECRAIFLARTVAWIRSSAKTRRAGEKRKIDPRTQKRRVSWYAAEYTLAVHSRHPTKTRGEGSAIPPPLCTYRRPREETINPFVSVSARHRLLLSAEVILPVLPSAMTSASTPLSPVIVVAPVIVLLFRPLDTRTRRQY